MDYCFDSVSIKDGICQIVGWVTAGDRADRIRIHAVDEKGQEIPVEVTRAARPDVGLAKYGDPKASDVGIFLRIRMNSSGEVRVVLEEIDPSGNLVDRFAEPVNGILIPLRGAYRDLKKTAIDTRMAVRDLRLRADGISCDAAVFHRGAPISHALPVFPDDGPLCDPAVVSKLGADSGECDAAGCGAEPVRAGILRI